MPRFEDNCVLGATDTKPGVCSSKQCTPSPHGKIHKPNHKDGCHVACKAPGYTNKPGSHRKR